jgi:hypothetical protein
MCHYHETESPLRPQRPTFRKKNILRCRRVQNSGCHLNTKFFPIIVLAAKVQDVGEFVHSGHRVRQQNSRLRVRIPSSVNYLMLFLWHIVILSLWNDKIYLTPWRGFEPTIKGYVGASGKGGWLYFWRKFWHRRQSKHSIFMSMSTSPGLPDGLFSNKKSQFG